MFPTGPFRKARRCLGILSALSLLAIGSLQAATPFITRTIFDDYTDAFDTTGLIGPAGFIKAFPAPMPASQTATTILTTTDSAGATREATLTHLDPAIDPLKNKGNASAFINTDLTQGPYFLGFGTDTSAPSRLDLSYDFTTTPIGILDAGTGNSHVIVSVFDTDGGDNIVSASLSFTDLAGNTSTRNLVDVGIDVAVIGDKLIPFTEFAGVDFTQLTDLDVSWENPGEAQYDGLIALAGAGTFASNVPEPGHATALLFLLVMGLSQRRRTKSP